MQKPTKEEILRTDRIHSRASEACEQIKAGHIITECIVLHPDENDSGLEVKWTVDDLAVWPDQLQAMTRILARRQESVLSIMDDGTALQSGSLNIPAVYNKTIERGLVLYRGSAAFLAAHPAPDPYTRGDRVGEADRG